MSVVKNPIGHSKDGSLWSVGGSPLNTESRNSINEKGKTMDKKVMDCITSLSYHVGTGAEYVTVPMEALEVVVEWAKTQVPEAADVPQVGDRYTFPNVGVMELKEIDEEADRYKFTDYAGRWAVFDRDTLKDKVFDVRFKERSRVVVKDNNQTGTITQILTTYTHWPYWVSLDNGKKLCYSADALGLL